MSDDGASGGRKRREKNQKSERVAAFEKLKKLKGSKHKYEVSEFENVYEEVDEREYSKRVLERQEDDWIVDDGTGYVEDGREIFDDDLDDESIFRESRKKKKRDDHGSGKRAKLENGGYQEKSSNIRSLLMNMPAKKQVPVSLDDDEILQGIMQEITGSGEAKEIRKEVDDRIFDSSGESSKNYLKNLTEIKPKAVSLKLAPKRCFANKKVEKPLTKDDCDMWDDSTLQDDSEESEIDVAGDLHNVQEEREKPKQNVEKKIEPKAKQKAEQTEKQNESEHHLCASMFQEEFSICDQFTEEKVTKENHLPAKDSEKVTKPLCSKEVESQIFKKTANPSDNSADSISSEHPAVVKNADGETALRFFWLDAHEERFKLPGVIFLFGKIWIEGIKKFLSCCLVVRNIERKIYVLPKDKMVVGGVEKDVTFLDVYNEFGKIAQENGIMEFRTRKAEMNNCFTPDVPRISEYMEVKYSANYKTLPQNLKGNTFSHVFGTGTSALERFLIERKIKGPCWLDVSHVQRATNCLSWCKVEMTVDKMENVSVAITAEKNPPPPVILLSLQIRSVLNHKNGQNEVALIVGLVNREFPLNHEPPVNQQFTQHFSIIAPLSDQSYPFDFRTVTGKQKGIVIEQMDSERALLNNFLAKLQLLDPDFIVGHDVLGFDFDILFQRLLLHKVANWSRFGRLRRNVPNPSEKKNLSLSKSYLSGRLPCDVMVSAKEHVQGLRSYDLESLCKHVLEKDTNSALTFEEVRQHYKNGQSLMNLVTQTLTDASNALQIMCQISAIPLALQITNIAGNVLSRTLVGGRAERNEFLLLHAFYEKNYLPPEKYGKKAKDDEDESKAQGKNKKANYSGGLVLEPKKGLYDRMVLVMDFNSLYPSIIMEFNICFTTVSLTDLSAENSIPDVPPSDLSMGILPTEIRKLVESRVMVRKLMQDSKITALEKVQLHTRQIALKLMANSMYGCLGFPYARFYAKPLAALITAKGREILLKSKEYVERMNYDVIYGDTDSIMINTNSSDFEEVIKVGKQILQAINKLYQCINLDIDGVYKYMLLLKKKKYAALEVVRQPDGSIKTKMKQKGLDIVRRDWSRIAVESGNFVVEQLLSDSPLEDRILSIQKYLTKLGKDLQEGNVPLPLLTVSKQLTKSVDQYVDDKGQPHVLVAKRLLKKGMARLKAGDIVSYVICNDGTTSSHVQRAYHLDELKVDKTLKIDAKYYLCHQIHPVINRILDPVEGMDSCRIAELLGIDPTPYQQSLQRQSKVEAGTKEDTIPTQEYFWSFIDSEVLKKCEGFSFTCLSCKTVNTMDDPFRKDEGGHLVPALNKCCNSNCSEQPFRHLPTLENKLTHVIRSHLKRYYQSSLVCPEPTCEYKTRYLWTSDTYDELGVQFPGCIVCKTSSMYREVTTKDIYIQFFFLKQVFDVQSSEHKKVPKLLPEVEEAYKVLQSQVIEASNCNSYSKVSLGSVFGYLKKDTKKNINEALENGVSSSELRSKHLDISDAP